MDEIIELILYFTLAIFLFITVTILTVVLWSNIFPGIID